MPFALTKSLAVAAGLVPLGVLVTRGLAGALGANPVEEVTHFTGDWALRFLVLTLAVTPVRQLFGWNAVIGYRRLLGLLCFFYACLHVSTYVVLDHFFDWRAIVEDVAKRPYVTAGFAAFVSLTPLAITSTRGWIRRLGKRWTQLHRLIYFAAIAAVVHYWWLVKADIREPLLYAAVVGVFLSSRVVVSLRARQKAVRRRPRVETLARRDSPPVGQRPTA